MCSVVDIDVPICPLKHAECLLAEWLELSWLYPGSLLPTWLSISPSQLYFRHLFIARSQLAPGPSKERPQEYLEDEAREPLPKGGIGR